MHPNNSHQLLMDFKNMPTFISSSSAWHQQNQMMTRMANSKATQSTAQRNQLNSSIVNLFKTCNMSNCVCGNHENHMQPIQIATQTSRMLDCSMKVNDATLTMNSSNRTRANPKQANIHDKKMFSLRPIRYITLKYGENLSKIEPVYSDSAIFNVANMDLPLKIGNRRIDDDRETPLNMVKIVKQETIEGVKAALKTLTSTKDAYKMLNSHQRFYQKSV